MLLEYYNAARNAAAVVKKDWIGALIVSGAERVDWLQEMVTNDIQKLGPGEGCYAAHLNAQGKLVAPMTVLMDEKAIWLIVERAGIDKLAAAFDRLIIMEDLQIQDVSAEFEPFGVIGPKAADVLEAW